MKGLEEGEGEGKGQGKEGKGRVEEGGAPQTKIYHDTTARQAPSGGLGTKPKLVAFWGEARRMTILLRSPAKLIR